MFYRSARLFLRPGWPEDWQHIWQGISDEGITRNLATAPWPYTPQDARNFVSLQRDPLLPSFLLTCPSQEGAVIGCAGLAANEGEVQLGYWIARPHWGQGYATEAAKAVLEIARMLGHEQIVASHFLDNPASGKVLRKTGFRPTGRVEAHYCLARDADADAAIYVCDLDEDERMPQRAA